MRRVGGSLLANREELVADERPKLTVCRTELVHFSIEAVKLNTKVLQLNAVLMDLVTGRCPAEDETFLLLPELFDQVGLLLVVLGDALQLVGGLVILLLELDQVLLGGVAFLVEDLFAFRKLLERKLGVFKF